MLKTILLGTLIPFVGTTLGAATVFLLKKQISDEIQKMLTGFAAGVMVAASFWSLLQPALESSAEMGSLAFVPAAVGFLAGVGFLLLLDEITPHMHMDLQHEGPQSKMKRTTKLILAVTLHNIPEGMAVGVVYAGWRSGQPGISQTGALALALGIALQNFPEGAIVSMPLLAEGMPRKKNILVWSPVRGGRTNRRMGHDPCGRHDDTDDALSFGLCGRCYDVRDCRGAYSGNVARKAFKLGDDYLFSGLCIDDDS